MQIPSSTAAGPVIRKAGPVTDLKTSSCFSTRVFHLNTNDSLCKLGFKENSVIRPVYKVLRIAEAKIQGFEEFKTLQVLLKFLAKSKDLIPMAIDDSRALIAMAKRFLLETTV